MMEEEDGTWLVHLQAAESQVIGSNHEPIHRSMSIWVTALLKSQIIPGSQFHLHTVIMLS